jgi:hypothetical protein
MDLLAHESTSSAVFSRSAGLLSGAGNADAEVKTRLSDKAADDLRVLARSFGMNISEFLRVLVLTRLYGVEGMTRMTQEQISLVAGSGPEKAQSASEGETQPC